MPANKENVAAGLFVLVGIVLAMVVLFVLADFRGLIEPVQEVKVQYRTIDGLRGLKVGAAVTLSNRPIGAVTAIDDVFEGSGDRERQTAQVVTFRVPARYRLYTDAHVEIDAPALGSDTKLNIRSVGSGDHERYDAARHPPLVGRIAASPLVTDLVREAGIDDVQRAQVRDILANVSALTRALREDVPPITAGARRVVERLDPMVDDLRAALDNAAHLLKQVDERSATWLTRIDTITKNADEAVALVTPLLQDADPKVRAALDDLRTISRQLREEAAPAAVATLRHTEQLAGEARDLVVGQRPVVERMLANMQLAGAQLKLAAIEVRRSPWRLLYAPTTSEIAHDNLYDAARSFALAAEAVQNTTDTLRALAAEDGDPAHAQRVQRMTDYLEQVTARFREAERAFWTELDGKPPAP